METNAAQNKYFFIKFRLLKDKVKAVKLLRQYILEHGVNFSLIKMNYSKNLIDKLPNHIICKKNDDKEINFTNLSLYKYFTPVGGYKKTFLTDTKEIQRMINLETRKVEKGCSVIINRGKFTGMTGVVSSVNKDTYVVKVTMFGREINITVDKSDI